MLTFLGVILSQRVAQENAPVQRVSQFSMQPRMWPGLLSKVAIHGRLLFILGIVHGIHQQGSIFQQMIQKGKQISSCNLPKIFGTNIVLLLILLNMVATIYIIVKVNKQVLQYRGQVH